MRKLVSQQKAHANTKGMLDSLDKDLARFGAQELDLILGQLDLLPRAVTPN